MLKTLWNAILYKPLYNLLVLLIILFAGNAGLAVVALTLLVKIILLPFTAKMIKSQVAMKAIEPKLQKIREEHATDKNMQSKKTFELYKEHKVNPFTGCFLLLIQFPIIIALYRVVLGGFTPHQEFLYGTVHFPENVSTMFLGFDITHNHLIGLALVVAALQFVQAWLAMRTANQNKAVTIPAVTTEGVSKKNMQAEMQQSMQNSMKYFLPVMVGFFVYTLPAAIGIYWAVNIIVTIAQEYYIRQRYTKNYERNN
ncbi:MAG: membrane protein insertase YidC [Candidatus Pacebacteria bacterium]|jgi:YidC/Oxa1 family membrane protein insertase|nr:membrane protein insertase YidC [Candidatus Paceibacterota bacterium]